MKSAEEVPAAELRDSEAKDSQTRNKCGRLQITGIAGFLPDPGSTGEEEDGATEGAHEGLHPPDRDEDDGGNEEDPPEQESNGQGLGFLQYACPAQCGWAMLGCQRDCMCWPIGHGPHTTEVPHTCHSCSLRHAELTEQASAAQAERPNDIPRPARDSAASSVWNGEDDGWEGRTPGDFTMARCPSECDRRLPGCIRVCMGWPPNHRKITPEWTHLCSRCSIGMLR